MLSNLDAAIVRNPLVARADATVLSAVEQMSRQEIDGENGSSTCVVIVSDELKVLGVLTQKDVMRLVTQQQPIAKLTLRQFLKQQRSPSDSLIISQSDLKDWRNINASIAYFESSQITHLAIVDAQDQLIGLLQHESLKRLRDNTIHQATASLLASQQKIHEGIAKAEPLKDVLGDLLQTMETYLRGSSCSITLCRDGRLGDVIAPSLPQDYAVALEKANLPITEGVGSCGTAAFRGELVVVTDIANDSLWQDYKNFALPYGLQACSSMPIFASDRTLLGAFGIYYHEQKAPQMQELDWIAQAANIAGIAIERDRATQALQQLNQDLENRVQVRTQELQEREQFLQTVLDTFPLSVFWKDVNSVYLGCNQNLLRDAGLSTIAQIIGKTDYEMPWGETEADIYQADDRAVIESQTAKLGIVETQYQANGQTIWVETNKLPLRNLQGDVIGVLGTYQDISDRKAVENALMLKQSHLTALMNNIPHIAWIKDEQSRFIAVNTPFVQACGVLAEELVGKTDFDIWSADLAQAYRDDDAEVLQSGQRKVVVEKIARADGTLGWLETTKTPFRDDQLNIAGTVGIAADITDLKMLELSLKASERRYASLAAAAPVAIFRFDTPLNCVYVNERWSDLSGLPMESALGHGWMQSLHPDDSEQRIAEWAEYYASSNPESQIIHGSEGRHLRPDGTTTWCYIQVAKEFDNDGNVVGYIGTLTDITDRKNTELVLQDLSDRLEYALNGANIGIWEWQMSDGRLLWDKRMFNLYGIPPEEFSSKHADWFNCIHPDDQERVKQAEQQAPQGAKECRIEFRIIHPDDTIRFIDSYVFNQYNAQGEIQKKVGLNIDITDRKQAEAQLQRINEELIKATRLKDEFLANMSHELRTPLNAILGMTEILQEQIFGDLNDRQLQSLQTIEKSGNHLLELINDILDVAKVEAGQIKLSCQPCNVETLCQSSLIFIKQQAFSKNIQVETEVPPNLPNINLDERRIRQVLINLLNNAVKFTPNGGKISLKVNYIKFLGNAAIANGSGMTCDTLKVSVIDTGIGIAPEQIKRLFQPFVQVDSALNRNYEGSGLGLVLVKRLVELHGGEVRLTSELGVGSCFTITIPDRAK